MVILLPSLGACGFNYQTDKVYQPGVGADNHKGTVNVLGGVVVSPGDAQGTFVASLVNTDLKEPQKLTSITGDGVQVKLKAPISVEPDSLVNLADSGAVGVTGEDIEPGNYVRLSLEFESGQKVDLNTPVVSNVEEYAGVTPASPSSPSDSASPSGSPSPSDSPTP